MFYSGRPLVSFEGKNRNLNIDIELGCSSDLKKDLEIRLTDDDDFYFLYSIRITVDEFTDYLQAEWNTRRSAQDGVLRFDKDTIRGFSPRVPVQSNLVDCGIYLLHYVEMFFKKPVQSYTKDYFQHEMAGWFPEATVSKKRAQIHDLLVNLRERNLREKAKN
ncbi:unnamed protein product [Schistosoma rodhaini]|uniref:Ubiquitin-like protease family profile domain-containing protein n=1 Tax=Schistosoma rodhaini TaxID=6188 RepID=A0AA85GHT8_9TREM|nr:unnamed protein product [Schistosoma rodhaini]